MKYYSKKGLTEAQLRNRELAMADLRAFIGLVAPYRSLGHCHHDMLKYLMEDHSHQLIIWPRGHQKSTMAAFWVAWYLINNPQATIILASSTADLAEKQLGFIKDSILTSPVVQKYWPELINVEEGKRHTWKVDEIVVDHKRRNELGIRDPSIKAVGMGKTITGFHCDVAVIDDIVTDENAFGKTERDKVKRWASLLVSIVNPGGMVKAVGTRYHPDDLYNEMTSMTEPIYDDVGNEIDEEAIYSYSMQVVEVDGEYLWPRQKGADQKFYGFNRQVLSKIRGQYIDKSQFYAQYYNDPSDPLNKRIENFQYYERDQLKLFEGRWCIGGEVLNVYAAIDFAATITERADYTAIVVIGVDKQHNIYILDIDRFKTNKISVMADSLEKHFGKWKWIKLRAEVNAQQGLIVEQIRDYNRKRGVYYNIDTINQIINKEIRIMTNLEPRYSEGVILHYRGGLCQLLEDELSSSKPPHDDMSDALASVIEIATAPARRRERSKVSNISFHPKWGGVQ
jgi:predicted phage terminase large subunit-like protein